MTPALDLGCPPTVSVPFVVAGGPGNDSSPSPLRRWNFRVPPELEAGAPPEARGRARDEVRLMVSYLDDSGVVHAQFGDLPCFLRPGDVLAVNTSGTMNAALAAQRADGTEFEMHLSTRLPGGLWTLELRVPDARGSQPFYDARPGEMLALPAGGRAEILHPYIRGSGSLESTRNRLWLAALDLPLPVLTYLAEHGFPIRYGYVKTRWPIEYYQTLYATETGSAEMPSAGRPFTTALLTRLVANGVWIAPLLLHTGVASLEDDEMPYEEFYRVPLATAHLVNAARAHGGRIISVGTTVMRALETVTDEEGTVHPGEGWTGLVITPRYHLRAVDGLLTGLHEPRSSHISILEALAGREHVRRAYSEALVERYLWHEFGDVHLIL